MSFTAQERETIRRARRRERRLRKDRQRREDWRDLAPGDDVFYAELPAISGTVTAVYRSRLLPRYEVAWHNGIIQHHPAEDLLKPADFETKLRHGHFAQDD